ncbi:hypothetical protein B9Z55_006781 [Caenorhabditis nigoni]|uniref:DUF281 domain-containing protein n=1 Tax=Caenorhabditis nigoni TaxID=1611254 RepID=A0A2G5V6Y7_9PELO|nr:hypothetical protein B9Z55_006781 [Caenorhabditis nigoni]
MRSSWIQNAIFLMVCSKVWADGSVCYQCATPNLESNWAITGLPLKPSNLAFEDKCDESSGDFTKESKFTSSICSSYCFELAIPINDEYGFVRGCHGEFVWEEFRVSNKSCQKTLFKKTAEDKSIYAGSHFCPPSGQEETKCNKRLRTIDMTEPMDECEALEIHTCKSCSSYNGAGSCSASTTDTCKAPYCTKTVGTFDDGSYESRSCAFFNPIGSNVCSWTDQTYNVSTGVNSVVQRTKRSVSMAFRANQCYCQGELCNSSPRFSTILLSFLSASFLAFL